MKSFTQIAKALFIVTTSIVTLCYLSISSAYVFPVNSQPQEYVIAGLLTATETFSTVIPKVSAQSYMDDYKFKWAFTPSPQALANDIRGKIVISEVNGKVVHNLVPLIDSYAHIIDFRADFKSGMLEKELVRVSAHGGPPQLEFYVNPNQIGFIKLFAQVKIKGKEIFVPFGLVVNPKRFSPA